MVDLPDRASGARLYFSELISSLAGDETVWSAGRCVVCDPCPQAFHRRCTEKPDRVALPMTVPGTLARWLSFRQTAG